MDAFGQLIPDLTDGHGHPVMPIHPKLTTEPAVLPGLEPLQPVQEDLVSRMLMHDAERIANPHTVMNRVVYDAIDPNPATTSARATTAATRHTGEEQGVGSESGGGGGGGSGGGGRWNSRSSALVLRLPCPWRNRSRR